jgi:hypothetical protein
MNNIKLDVIFEESLVDMSFTPYWQCPRGVTGLVIEEDIRPVYFERIKPRKYIFGLDTSRILIKTYDHKLVSGIYNIQQIDLKKMLAQMTKMFDCTFSHFESFSQQMSNPYEEVETKDCIDDRSFLDTLHNEDRDYYFFRTRDDALYYYSTQIAEQNALMDKHKVTNVEQEALDKFPEVFI